LKLLKSLFRWLWYALLLLLILLIIAVLVVRFIVFPNIDSYKDDISNYATKTLGQKVNIGQIDTGWRGISPHIELKNIDVFDAQNKVAFHLNDVAANVSWLSVPMMQPRLANLIVKEPALNIHRTVDGAIYLAGINMAGKSKPDFANWLISQSEVNIKNAQITWQDDMRQAPALSLTQLNITLSNPTFRSLFGKHSFTLSALPSVGTKEMILANGYFVGNDVAKTKEWRGELATELKQADLAIWRPWFDYPIDIKSGSGNAKIWLDFADAKIEKVKTLTDISNLSVVLNQQPEPLTAKQFSGELTWSDLKNTQTLTAKNLKLSTNTALAINDGNGYIASSQKDGKPWIKADLKIDQFNLTAIHQLAPYFKLPDNIKNQLTGFAPKGELQNLALIVEGLAEKPSNYKFNSAFKQLSINAHQKVPGFTNLTGNIKATQNGGEVTLAAKDATLDVKNVLRWPIPASQLNGLVSWKLNGDKAVINAKDLFISSPHLTGTINANYDMNGVKGGHMDLTGKFGQGNAKFAPFYYPLTLSQPTIHWLDTSILAGRAEDINLIIKGNMADFPFVNSKNQLDAKLGLFKVTANVSNAILEYGAEWPVINDLNISLLFEGKRMELNSSKGRIFGNKILKSKTEIAQLDADSPILTVDGVVQGTTAEGIKYVNESPVKQVTQGFTDGLKTAGNGELLLSLKIPLQHLETSQYKGAYKISNGTIFANESAGLPELNKINGVLNFTENSLNADNVNAEIVGEPLQFNLKTGADKIIRLSAKGKINEAGIKKFAANMVTDNMQGSADWTSEITIQKPMVDVLVQSNLTGMAINLPAPFNKAASQSMPFKLEKKQLNLENDVVNISLGDTVSATLMRSTIKGKTVIERGDIGILSAAITPTQAGLALHGKLDHVDVDEWLALKAKSPTNTQTDSSALNFSKADFTVQKFDAFGRRINNLKVISKPTSNGLQMTINSTELDGDVEWLSTSQNAAKKKIIARLKNLSVPKATPNATAATVGATKVALKKEFRKQNLEYPALDITVDNFEISQKKLGALSLNAFENGEDWVIEKLQITNADSVLNLQGNWHNWSQNPNTNLVVSLSSNNIGKTLKRFGQPDAVKDGVATVDGTIQWPGSPHEFDIAGLSGNLKLDVAKGQFLKVDPSVGRLLGLLSLQSLPRRLSLDFRDLFSDGFAFDKITATATISNGILRSNDFLMDGPAAEARIKGETNLKAETQNLKVRVRPHVSDSLSLAAFAGGPIAGVAAFVAQKLLKDPFNKIVQSEYVISGTWDKPVEVKSESEQAPINNNSPLTQSR
jgi:uncharacterized protein (TIGR02099 family)